MEKENVKEKFIIIKVYGVYYDIENPFFGVQRATLKGKLRLGEYKERHPFVVGDYVNAKCFDGNWIIQKRYERKNYLVRKSNPVDTHVLCANVDKVAIIASLKNPETKDGFIDRSIAAIYHSKISPLILFSKKDLVNENEISLRSNKYISLGYEVLAISNDDKSSIDKFLSLIEGKTTYLVGNSGVGKSTFVNLITNKPIQKIKEVSSTTHKGKHTTTNTTAIFLNSNTILIDSPGIKEWGILHLTLPGLLMAFPELEEHVDNCSIPNCCRAQEGCAMLEYLDSDKMDSERRKSMKSMMFSLQSDYRLRADDFQKSKYKRRK